MLVGNARWRFAWGEFEGRGPLWSCLSVSIRDMDVLSSARRRWDVFLSLRAVPVRVGKTLGLRRLFEQQPAFRVILNGDHDSDTLI